MKNVLYILFLFSYGCAKPQTIRISASPFRGTSPSDLIVIAGESNAGGLASNDSLTVYELAPRASTKILNNSNLSFENLDIGTNNLILHQGLTTNASHGVENGLANCADSGLLGALPIYILKGGTGNSKIAQWNDSTIIADGVNAWLQCKARIDTAIKQLTVLNKGIAPSVYLFWTLGINDAVATENASQWKDSVKVFFAKFRSRYGANVPVMMTLFSPDTYYVQMNEIAAEISNCYAMATPAANGAHWNEKQFKIIASTFVKIIRDHYAYR